MKKYNFSENLIEGMIKSRPNRFIMWVEVEGVLEKCHCPSTGRIGSIDFKNIPCLLSRSDSKKRKTKYTVEAIRPEPNYKCWVGINQVKANAYIDFYLKNNLLKDMIAVSHLRREVMLNDSKIDFYANDNCYLEVKTLLKDLPFGTIKNQFQFDSFDRLVRHYTEISQSVNEGQRAIVVLCNLYNAEPFVPPLSQEKNAKFIKNSIKTCVLNGVEHWQVNLQIDPSGISLLNCFKLDLLSHL